MSAYNEFNYLNELETRNDTVITETDEAIDINGVKIHKNVIKDTENYKLFEVIKEYKKIDARLLCKVIMGYKDQVFAGINDERTIIYGWIVEKDECNIIMKKIRITQDGWEYHKDTQDIFRIIDGEFATANIQVDWLKFLFIGINFHGKTYIVNEMKKVNNEVILICTKENDIYGWTALPEKGELIRKDGVVLNMYKNKIYDDYKKRYE